jgi:hypothetical protein
MPIKRLLARLTVEWGVVFGAAALITWAGNFWVAALIVLIANNFAIGWIKWVERNWPDTVV